MQTNRHNTGESDIRHNECKHNYQEGRILTATIEPIPNYGRLCYRMYFTGMYGIEWLVSQRGNCRVFQSVNEAKKYAQRIGFKTLTVNIETTER